MHDTGSIASLLPEADRPPLREGSGTATVRPITTSLPMPYLSAKSEASAEAESRADAGGPE